MAINANTMPKAGGGNTFTRTAPYLESGSYPARLVAITVLGTQPQKAFKGEAKPDAMEIMLTYELLDEFMPDDDGEPDETKPRWISETIPFRNLAADRATSTRRYYVLDPKEEHNGDWEALLGTPCLVTIALESWIDKKTQEERFKEVISQISAMRPREAAKAPELVNDPRVFNFYDPDMTVWEKIPNWLKDKMKAASDYTGSALEKALASYVPPKKGEIAIEDDKPTKAPRVSRKPRVAAPEDDVEIDIESSSKGPDDEIPW